MTRADGWAHPAWKLDRLPSPVGDLLLVADGEGAVYALDWADCAERMESMIKARMSRGGLAPRPARAPRAVRDALEAYFCGDFARLDAIRVVTGGTPFQRSVWRALRGIAAGVTATYQQVAAGIGAPRAARAVGLANRGNPVSLIVPCHRVIGATGALTGYAGGLASKRWLLAHEGAVARRDAGAKTAGAVRS